MSDVETRGQQGFVPNNKSYALAHDSPEQRRLEQQSHAIWKLMGDRHITAPVPDDATFLIDVGCGMGNVTRLLATEHPDAKVVGVDLVPLLDPSRSPPNMTFVQGDILDLAGKDTQLLPYGKADLVFSRLLVAGLRDGKWPRYVEIATRLVKPGGYVNLVDLSVRGYSCSDLRDPIGTKKAERVEALDVVRDAAARHGFDFDCGTHLERLMKEAGLVDVEVEEYPWALGRWMDHNFPPARASNYEGQGSGLANAFRPLFRSHMSEQEVERRANDVRELMDNGVGHFMLLYAVRGRKPPVVN